MFFEGNNLRLTVSARQLLKDHFRALLDSEAFKVGQPLHAQLTLFIARFKALFPGAEKVTKSNATVVLDALKTAPPPAPPVRPPPVRPPVRPPAPPVRPPAPPVRPPAPPVRPPVRPSEPPARPGPTMTSEESSEIRRLIEAVGMYALQAEYARKQFLSVKTKEHADVYESKIAELIRIRTRADAFATRLAAEGKMTKILAKMLETVKVKAAAETKVFKKLIPELAKFGPPPLARPPAPPATPLVPAATPLVPPATPLEPPPLTPPEIQDYKAKVLKFFAEAGEIIEKLEKGEYDAKQAQKFQWIQLNSLWAGINPNFLKLPIFERFQQTYLKLDAVVKSALLAQARAPPV